MISEATARARMKAVKASFPEGPITEAQAQDMLMAMVDSQVGYASNSATWSMYGKPQNWPVAWNGRQVYWCALGLSCMFTNTFGAKAAAAGIGLQTTNPNWPPAGWTATWLWLGWLRNNNRWVGMERARKGSIIMESWGRTSHEVDHVEVASGPYRKSDDSVPGYGFNTATGNSSAGAGVMRVRRYRRNIVGVYDPDWTALVMVYNAERAGEAILELTEEVIEYLELLGYEGSVTGVRAFQGDHGLVVDGIVGPITSKALEDKVSEVLDAVKALERKVDQMDTVNVHQSTADFLATGRKGTQPRGWFLDLVGRRVGRIDRRVHSLRDLVVSQGSDQAGAVAGLQEAVNQLAEKVSGGIDLTAVEAASQRGAEAAFTKAKVSTELTFADDDEEEES